MMMDSRQSYSARIGALVPDEAVEAANAALAVERRLPAPSMRAAILAALPHLPTMEKLGELLAAVERLEQDAEVDATP